MTIIAPSILSADFARLKEEIEDVERGGADWIHIDVMDGHFVPNLTFGALAVRAVRPHTKLTLDVHLMMEHPDRYMTDFVQAGADIVTVHAEACTHLHRTVHAIKEQGVKAGVALNPATPAEWLEPMIEDIDLILVMTVNPGFGGQSFITSQLRKIEKVRQMLNEHGLDGVHIEVDGGIDPVTAGQVTAAGANVLVAGSAVFGQPDRKKAIQLLRGGSQA